MVSTVCSLTILLTCKYVSGADGQVCAESTFEDLEQTRMQCMAAVLPYLRGYIWQQDPFTLHNSISSSSPWSKVSLKQGRCKDDASPAHLWGVARFGDNIEDEWLIVWLLYQITVKVCKTDTCLTAILTSPISIMLLANRNQRHSCTAVPQCMCTCLGQ